MSKTTVSNLCLFCKQPIQDASTVVYVNNATASKKPLKYQPMTKDRIRIIHHSKNSNKGAIHMSCWDTFMTFASIRLIPYIPTPYPYLLDTITWTSNTTIVEGEDAIRIRKQQSSVR